MNIVHFDLDAKPARALHIANPGKPVMVFLMGSMQEIESVQKFNVAFGAEYDYWCVELPGSGNTAPLPDYYPVSYLGGLLESFVERYIKAPFDLVACSYILGFLQAGAQARAA